MKSMKTLSVVIIIIELTGSISLAGVEKIPQTLYAISKLSEIAKAAKAAEDAKRMADLNKLSNQNIDTNLANPYGFDPALHGKVGYPYASNGPLIYEKPQTQESFGVLAIPILIGIIAILSGVCVFLVISRRKLRKA